MVWREQSPNSPDRRIHELVQAKDGGDRPYVLTASSAPSGRASRAKSSPASARRQAPGAGQIRDSDPSGFDAHDVQCCGVFRWQMRSWCSNGAAARKRIWKPTPTSAMSGRRRRDLAAAYLHHTRGRRGEQTSPPRQVLWVSTSWSLTRARDSDRKRRAAAAGRERGAAARSADRSPSGTISSWALRDR